MSCLLRGLTLTASDPNRTETGSAFMRPALDSGFLDLDLDLDACLVLWFVNGFDARDALESPVLVPRGS